MDDVFKALADPSRRKLLDLLHEHNGQTLAALCEHLTATQTVYASISSRTPFYIGQFRWKKRLYRGAHEPIVSRELFDKSSRGLRVARQGSRALQGARVRLRKPHALR